ncbi:MAG TPA: ABC transporter substrate-binding protein [bacterium]
MARSWFRLFAVAVVAVALTVGLVGPGTAQPRLRPLVIAMPTTPPNLIHIPPWIALETGLFAKYGLDAKMLTFEGGPAALRALIGGGGSVHLAAPGIPPFVAAVGAGAELRAVATYSMKHPVAMVAQGEIKTCADLRGKKIGTPGGTGAYSEVMARAYLATCGLTPRDVQYINIAIGARVPALVSGQIDAMVLHVDQLFEVMQQKKSLRLLAHMAEVLPKGWYAAYITTFDLITKDPKFVQDAVMALTEANRFIYQNRDRTIEIGMKYTKFDKDIISRTYDELVKRGVWPVNEGLRQDLVEAGIDTEVSVGTITGPAKPTFDNTTSVGFVRAAITKLGRWTGDPRWY